MLSSAGLNESNACLRVCAFVDQQNILFHSPEKSYNASNGARLINLNRRSSMNW